MKEITFTNVLGLDFFPPKPAVKEVPEWYKHTPEYVAVAAAVAEILAAQQTPATTAEPTVEE
jgi:hypothetical protein